MGNSKSKFILGALTALVGVFFFSHPAYATFSASISRSGTVSIAEPGSSTIRPTSAGTLGTGVDTVSVTTNCAYGGYKLYVSATSTGGTNLTLPDGSDYIPTSSNLIGSETTLSRDTWGVGKTASAFSGLQSYSLDIGALTPFYSGTSSASYDFYYGVNVSTAKTPGTYTGEVLYTVLMDEACTKYTLSFNGNNATTNTLTPQDLDFDSTIDLASISSLDKIARTGYTLTGWKDQNNNSYGITGEVDINPNDLSSVTLAAQWEINSHTVTIGKGSNVTTVSGANTYTYGSTVTIAATAFSTGYHFSGWTVNSGGVALYSNSAMTTQSITSTPAYFTMPDNDVTITANAAANTYTIKFNGQGGTVGTSSTTGIYGGSITSSTASYSGYNLVGWSHTAYTAGQGSATYATTSTTSLAVSTLASAAGVTNTNGATINLYTVWKASVQDCSGTVHPTTTTGCKMKDGNIWILGNSGDIITWYNLCTRSDDCKSSTYCPTGYSIPAQSVYSNLMNNQGSKSQLYSALGLSETRSFWSSTQAANTNYAQALSVGNSRAAISAYNKSGPYYVLCYK